MKNYWILAAAISFTINLSAQSPFSPQLAIPVHFGKTGDSPKQAERHGTKTYLSGMALLFLDTASIADELWVSGGSDLVIWHEYVGQSTKATFYVPDSAFIGRIELIYFAGKCKAKVTWVDRNNALEHQANGELLINPNGEYYLSLDAEESAISSLNRIFHPLNVDLMQLYNRKMRRVEVKSWFDNDSINMIVGADSQFDTNFDLLWLDQSLRQRIHLIAVNAFSKLVLFNKPGGILQDSIVSKNRVLLHQAERSGKGIKGKLSIKFKPDESTRYVFLKPFNQYQAEIEYSFVYNKQGLNELSIGRFGLRNLQTGDFVDMNIFDFVNYSLPVMYVDLINGVVTGEDVWNITNVIHVIEDVVASSNLPSE
jgi:hypothetical protein